MRERKDRDSEATAMNEEDGWERSTEDVHGCYLMFTSSMGQDPL